MTPFLRTSLFATVAAVAGVIAAVPVHAETATVEVTGSRMRAPFVTEIDAAVGRYELSDGRQLELRARGNAINAYLDGEPSVIRLQAVSLGSSWELRSASGRMRMSFGEDRGGSVKTATIMLFGSPQQEQVAQLTAQPRTR